jgi:hypothetical protein
VRLSGWILLSLLFWGCHDSRTPLPYPLTITPEGVGAIHLNGTFDIPLLCGKLPGFEIKKLSSVIPDQPQTILQLTRHDEPIVLIVSDSTETRIAQIIVSSPLLKDSAGVGINDILPLSERVRCDHNQCHYKDIPTIIYSIEPQSRSIREITVQ